MNDAQHCQSAGCLQDIAVLKTEVSHERESKKILFDKMDNLSKEISDLKTEFRTEMGKLSGGFKVATFVSGIIGAVIMAAVDFLINNHKNV